MPLKEFLFYVETFIKCLLHYLVIWQRANFALPDNRIPICMNEVILERILLSSFDYLSANNSDNTLCTDKPSVNFYSPNYKPEMQNDLGVAKVAPSRFSCFHTFIFSLPNTREPFCVLTPSTLSTVSFSHFLGSSLLSFYIKILSRSSGSHTKLCIFGQ